MIRDNVTTVTTTIDRNSSRILPKIPKKALLRAFLSETLYSYSIYSFTLGLPTKSRIDLLPKILLILKIPKIGAAVVSIGFYCMRKKLLTVAIGSMTTEFIKKLNKFLFCHWTLAHFLSDHFQTKLKMLITLRWPADSSICRYCPR